MPAAVDCRPGGQLRAAAVAITSWCRGKLGKGRRLERQLGQAGLQKTEASVLGEQAKGVFHPLLGGDEPRGLAEFYEPKHKLSCWNSVCADEKGKCMR